MNHTFTIIPLTIETKGEITQNNLSEFRDLVREALGNINRDLVTDDQFGQAELDVKALKSAEEAVRGAAAKAFDEKLSALIGELNETAEEIRVPRLELEKLIANRKEIIKGEIVEEYLAAFDIDPKDARRQYLSGLQNSIKGKRTVESMRNACRMYQVNQQEMIKRSRASIEKFISRFGADLVMDKRELELKNVDVVEAELVRRMDLKKADDEKKDLQVKLDAANATAKQAKHDLAESSKPPAPPSDIDTGPWSGNESKTRSAVVDVEAAAGEVVSNEMPSIEAEWDAFKNLCIDSFRALKPFRESLRHPANIERAQQFADGLNAAWKSANRKEAA